MPTLALQPFSWPDWQCTCCKDKRHTDPEPYFSGLPSKRAHTSEVPFRCILPIKFCTLSYVRDLQIAGPRVYGIMSLLITIAGAIVQKTTADHWAYRCLEHITAGDTRHRHMQTQSSTKFLICQLHNKHFKNYRASIPLLSGLRDGNNLGSAWQS